MTRSILAIPLIAVCGTLCAAQSPSGDDQAFRTRTDLVVLDVSVENGTGQFVPSLTANELLVLEDDVPQNVTFFSADGRLPLAVALVVDHSQSMAGEPLDRAKAAAAAFLRTLDPDDRVEVLAFNDTTARLYPLGGDRAAAERSIRDLSACGGTALYDTMRVAVSDLERARAGHASDYRSAVVVLSDGEDTFSREPFEDLLEGARRSGVSVEAISIRTDARGRLLPPAHELAQLAFDTGGEAVAVRRLADLTSVYEDISTELRRRYRIGYVSSSASEDGGWRRISVRVPNKDVVARTRAGYYAPRSGGAF